MRRLEGGELPNAKLNMREASLQLAPRCSTGCRSRSRRWRSWSDGHSVVWVARGRSRLVYEVASIAKFSNKLIGRQQFGRSARVAAAVSLARVQGEAVRR